MLARPRHRPSVRHTGRRRLTWLVLGGLLLPGLAWGVVLATSTVVPGLMVLGTPVSGMPVRAQLEHIREAWSGSQVVLVVGETVFRTTRRELGVALAVSPMVRRVQAYGRSGNPITDLRDLYLSATGHKDLPWPPMIERRQLGLAIDVIRRHVEVPPAVGTRDDSGEVIAGRDGVTLNFMAEVASLEASLRAGAARIQLGLLVVAAPDPLPIGVADGVYLEDALRRNEAGEPNLPEALLAAQQAAVPLEWLPDQGRECITKGRFSGFCEGPRRAPMPHGQAAHLAQALQLGGARAVGNVIGGRVPMGWLQAAPPITSGDLLWPVPQGRLWRGFGIVTHTDGHRRLHKGLDIGSPAGTPIRSVRAGLVVYSDNSIRGYGNLLVVSHGDGTAAFYAHCQAIYVFPGQQVRQGSIVGEVGDTGFARGKHLHFELYDHGEPIDSMPHFRSSL